MSSTKLEVYNKRIIEIPPYKDQARATGNMQTINEVLTGGSWDMYVDRQTDRQAHHNTLHHYRAGVITLKQSQCNKCTLFTQWNHASLLLVQTTIYLKQLTTCASQIITHMTVLSADPLCVSVSCVSYFNVYTWRELRNVLYASTLTTHV